VITANSVAMVPASGSIDPTKSAAIHLSGTASADFTVSFS
jgi:hypothetical protein